MKTGRLYNAIAARIANLPSLKDHEIAALLANPLGDNPDAEIKPAHETYAERFNVLAAMMPSEVLQRPFAPPYTSDSGQYWVYRDKAGVSRLIFADPNGVCRFVDKEHLAKDIARWSEDLPPITTENGQKDIGSLSSKQCSEAAAQFINNPYCRELIDIPARIKMKSDPGLCFHRLDFDPDPTAPCPVFDSILERMDYPRQFLAFVGSIFDADSYNQQYAWLSGEGGSGKSTLATLIQRMLGDAYYAGNIPEGASERRWFVNQVKGKRLVVFNEADDPKFCASGWFKSLSGGDAQKDEEKGGKAITVRLDAKFMFLANDLPEISTAAENTRRALFFELETIEDENYRPDPRFIQRLWLERAAILGKALATYQSECPDKGPIPFDMPSWVPSQEDERWERVLDCFDIADWPDRESCHARPAQVTQALRSCGFYANKHASDFKKYLKRRRIAEFKIFWDAENKKTRRGYFGLKMKFGAIGPGYEYDDRQ